MSAVNEMLPFLIPLAVIQLGLTVASLVHVLTHRTYKTGTRTFWVLLSFVSIIGPVLYFVFGRSDE